MTDVAVTLVFDSWVDCAPERRSRKTEDRHLIYEGGGIVLDLLLKECSQADRIHVGGQILLADSPGSAGGIIVQLRPEGHSYVTQTNALGEFVFESVPRLLLELCIKFPNQRVVVRDLSFDEPHQWKVAPMMDARGAL